MSLPLHPQIRFIVMGNIFNADMPIHRRYDLKGSTQGRRSDRDPDTPGIICKDLDLDFQLQLEPGWKARLERQLREDSHILQARSPRCSLSATLDGAERLLHAFHCCMHVRRVSHGATNLQSSPSGGARDGLQHADGHSLQKP